MSLEVLQHAIQLVQSTPGYEAVGAELRTMISGRFRIDANLPDRAQAGLLGTITLGPEALESSPLSLAQTLVHEHFHLHQNPFLKTASFWSGVVSRTPVMAKYERPAYQAAVAFLRAAARAHPALAAEAAEEERAIRQVFAQAYGGTLD